MNDLTNEGERPQAPPPQAVPEIGEPHSHWCDAAMVAMSRDTRAFLNENPDPEGSAIGDWFDSRQHSLILYSLAKWVNWPDPRYKKPSQPPRAVEIGVRHGVTTLPLLQAMKETDGELTSIDIDSAWGYATSLVVERAGLTPWWDFRIGNSDDVIEQLRGTSVDFLWIDGDHSEAQVRKDVANYAPLVRVGGIMALHDYYSLPWPCEPPVQPPNESYVSVIVEQDIRPTGDWEVLVLPFGFGLVICRRVR